MNKVIRFSQFTLAISIIALFLGLFAQSDSRAQNYGNAPIINGNLEPISMTTRIVWHDGRNWSWEENNTDIYMYDLSTNKESQITTNKNY